MVITRKIEVGNGSNLLHSISTSICIRKCNKNLGPLWVESMRSCGKELNMNDECELTKRISLSQFDSQSTDWNDKEVKDEAKSKIDELSEAFRSVITLVGEDPDREGLKATPLRAAKAFFYFTKGYEETVAGELIIFAQKKIISN